MSVSQMVNPCFYGQFSQFDLDQETMSAYLERVQIFSKQIILLTRNKLAYFSPSLELRLMDYHETYWLQQSQWISHLQNSPRLFVLIISRHHSLLPNASISPSTTSSQTRVMQTIWRYYRRWGRPANLKISR